mgnify:CR=1 FL=1
MTSLLTRTRAFAALFILGMAGLLATACVPEPQVPYYGIIFNAPANTYLNRTFTPEPTATSGLPVTVTLDSSSTACSLVGGVVTFVSLGNCVLNANQPGNATFPAAPQVQRTIVVRPCPVLRAGAWTGFGGLVANVSVVGSTFSGSADLTSLGFGVVTFGGVVNCEVASMTFNGEAITGVLTYDGRVLSSNYNGIDIVLNAPA